MLVFVVMVRILRLVCGCLNDHDLKKRRSNRPETDWHHLHCCRLLLHLPHDPALTTVKEVAVDLEDHFDVDLDVDQIMLMLISFSF